MQQVLGSTNQKRMKSSAVSVINQAVAHQFTDLCLAKLISCTSTNALTPYVVFPSKDCKLNSKHKFIRPSSSQLGLEINRRNQGTEYDLDNLLTILRVHSHGIIISYVIAKYQWLRIAKQCLPDTLLKFLTLSSG